jgi:uncharacterized protein YndB with AHSA1/START domain
MAKRRSVSRTRIVAGPAEEIFSLLADPSKHSLIDGSGTVRDARSDAPERLAMGSTFGMNMKFGVAYKMTNTVMEFEENRLIAWRHIGGHRWRYELEPVDGGTKVTETFDWSTAKAPLALELTKTPQRNVKSIEKTLDRLAARFAKSSSDQG